jgi:hypothetical protein
MQVTLLPIMTLPVVMKTIVINLPELIIYKAIYPRSKIIITILLISNLDNQFN